MRIKDILRDASRVVGGEEVEIEKRPKYVILTFKASILESKEIQIQDLTTQFSDFKPSVKIRNLDKEKQTIQRYLKKGGKFLL